MIDQTAPLQTPSTVQPASSAPLDVNKLKQCDTCIRGGMPLKKEVLSFIVIGLVMVITVLVVALVHEKREMLAIRGKGGPAVASAPSKKYELPAPAVINEYISLPNPDLDSQVSIEASLLSRRSRRIFAPTPVSLENMSQLLWSAQGITEPELGHRTAPSGMGAYPFTVYVVVREAEGLNPGLYVYDPIKNQLGALGMANAGELLTAAGVQEAAQKAPVVYMLVAAPAKTVAKSRTPDADPMENILLEAGHIGQNMYLQAESRDMSLVVMGGFDAAKVRDGLKLSPQEEVIYIIPAGNRSNEVEAAE
jgi:SagB-type dehydrogenase family enzyme